jgi:hypothetical protein
VSFVIADANGYVGDLATITGYGDLIGELEDATEEGEPDDKLVLQFVASGHTANPQELARHIERIRFRMKNEMSPDKNSTMVNLVSLLRKCKEVAIVTES